MPGSDAFRSRSATLVYAIARRAPINQGSDVPEEHPRDSQPRGTCILVDVYRGQQRAVRNPVDYALFICFFPQLVAGPIVRARNFFHDLFHWQPPTGEDVSRGILLLVLGLTKKMAFADQFDLAFLFPLA